MKRALFNSILCCLLLYGVVPVASFAQDGSVADDTTDISKYYADLAIPDNGISNLLQVELTEVQSLNNIKDFAIQILNSQDEMDAKGFGIEFSLGNLLTDPRKRSMSNYINNTSYRTWTKVRPVLGYSRSESGTNVAFGFNYNIANRADYRMDSSYREKVYEIFSMNGSAGLRELFATVKGRTLKSIPESHVDNFVAIYYLNRKDTLSQCEHEKFKKEVIETRGDTDSLGVRFEEDIDELRGLLNEYIISKITRNEAISKLLEEERDKYIKENWNAGFATLNTGMLWNSPDGRISGFRSTKWQLALATGFRLSDNDRRTQILFTLKASGDVAGRSLINNENPAPEQEQATYFAGTRWLFKLNSKEDPMTANFFLEGGLRRTTFFDRDFKDELKGVLGVELKVYEGFWLQAGIGFENDQSNFQLDLKHAFTKKSRFE